MRNIFLAILIIFSPIPAAIQAQEKFEGGLKVGVNVSNFNGRVLDNHEAISRTSYHIGLLGEFALTSRWNLQPELLYSEQGFGFRNDILEEYNVSLNYLQLPVLVEYELLNNFSLQSGPQLSYLLKEDYNTISRRINYNRFDFSLGFGAEYELGCFLFYSRYTVGLNRIYNNSGDRNQNQVFQAGVGYIF